MRNSKLIILGLIISVSALALSGCEKEVQNGQIPSEYLSSAQQFMGTYVGTMEGQSAKFTLSADANGVAKMTYTDTDGDIVGKNCNTKIGQLTALDGDNHGNFKGARFAIKTGCNIEGTSVFVGFAKNGAVSLDIVESSYTTTEWVHDPGETICDDQGHCHHVGGGSHTEQTTHYNYITGKFTKK